MFGSLTVLENLEMGAYPQRAGGTGAASSSASTRCFRSSPSAAAKLAGTLSGGEQQMLAIGRGLASSPRLLMLDEPSMGLAPGGRRHDLRTDLASCIADGLTILLVEQRVAEAFESCDHGYVLETGRVVLEGTYQTLLADDRIRRVYLGL